MTRGIVMEIGKRHAVVLTPDGRFCKVPAEQAGSVGQEISFAERARRRRPRILYSAGIGAAAVMLIVFIPILTLFNGAKPAVAAYLTLDINPSVELGVNDREMVEEIRALNKDGEAIIAGLPYKDLSAGDVAGAIMDRVDSGAYLQGGTNDIVITSVVLSATFSGASESELTQHVDQAVQEALGRFHQDDADKIEVTTLSAPKELRDEANENGISTGKMAVYLMAKSEGHDVTIDEMKEKSIHQAAEAWGGLDAVVKGNGAKKDNSKPEDSKPESQKGTESVKPDSQQPANGDSKGQQKDNGKDQAKNGQEQKKQQDKLQKQLEEQKKRLKELLEREKHESPGGSAIQAKQPLRGTDGGKTGKDGDSRNNGLYRPDKPDGDKDKSKDEDAERKTFNKSNEGDKDSYKSGAKDSRSGKENGPPAPPSSSGKNGRDDESGPGGKQQIGPKSDGKDKGGAGGQKKAATGGAGIVQADIGKQTGNPASGRGSEKNASDGRVIGVQGDRAAKESGAESRNGNGPESKNGKGKDSGSPAGGSGGQRDRSEDRHNKNGDGSSNPDKGGTDAGNRNRAGKENGRQGTEVNGNKGASDNGKSKDGKSGVEGNSSRKGDGGEIGNASKGGDSDRDEKGSAGDNTGDGHGTQGSSGKR